MCVSRLYWLGLVLAATLAPLSAQVGYPGGGYPPGGYPGGGGVGFPVPHRHKKQKPDTKNVETQSIEGMLRRIDKDQVILEADDNRILNFKRSDTTRFLKDGDPIKPAELRPGDHLLVEASQDDQGFLYAINVVWQKDGSAAERRQAAEPVETSEAKSSDEDQRPVLRRADAHPAPEDPNPADLNAPVAKDVPAVQIDPGDEGPPVLKRGPKVARREAEAPPAGTPEEEPRPTITRTTETERPEDAVIEQAREAAGTFLEGLPNYICQEYMARYISTSHVVSWQPQDIVSAEVVYENQHERYRNIAINGKVTKKRMEELPGAWSTGEFGTVLADVFSPATAADFRFRKESRSAGRTALLYDFSVDREHSAWKIMVASQMVLPAYKGSVWIDKETKRVLRIEMQAAHLPEAFPADKVESATDYEFVRFADRQYLVPVRAETLSCQRGTDNCSRNTIDFRNYHKYSGEATITFGN